LLRRWPVARELLSKPPEQVGFQRNSPSPEILGLCSLTVSKGNIMNAWSSYLRGQAAIAGRHSKAMTTPETIKEFADIADSFRRDADAEDANPTYKH
jgi:hypothetical protein